MFMLTGNAYGSTLYLDCDSGDPVRTVVDLSDKGQHFVSIIQGPAGRGKVVFSRWFD